MGGVTTHTHTCMCMHAHAHMHIYTCIEMQMATDMEASMFRMFSSFNMHVHACVCMHAWDTPSTHPCPSSSPSTHLPPLQGVDPRNHLKFDNTSTYQVISILFEDLKSVKNSPPMGGCVVWWVGGWLGGLMGGVRSNH